MGASENASLAAELAKASSHHDWFSVIADLAAIGYEIVKSDANSEAPDLSQVYKRVEPKVLALLARCSPKGSTVTPEIIEQARAGIVEILADELVRVARTRGMA
jgi:hypothetical protein